MPPTGQEKGKRGPVANMLRSIQKKMKIEEYTKVTLEEGYSSTRWPEATDAAAAEEKTNIFLPNWGFEKNDRVSTLNQAEEFLYKGISPMDLAEAKSLSDSALMKKHMLMQYQTMAMGVELVKRLKSNQSKKEQAEDELKKIKLDVEEKDKKLSEAKGMIEKLTKELEEQKTKYEQDKKIWKTCQEEVQRFQARYDNLARPISGIREIDPGFDPPRASQTRAEQLKQVLRRQGIKYEDRQDLVFPQSDDDDDEEEGEEEEEDDEEEEEDDDDDDDEVEGSDF